MVTESTIASIEISDLVTNSEVTATQDDSKKRGAHESHSSVINNKYKCNYCVKTFSMSSNSSLVKHLRKQHLNHCPELERKNEMKPSSSTFFQPKRKMFTVEGFRRVLLKLLVKRDIPFSFVEYPEPIELFAYIDPGCSSLTDSSLCR